MFNGYSDEMQFLARYTATYLGELRSRKVRIADQDCSYLDAGSGPAVVFLHNAGGSKIHWRTLMHNLANNYRVIAVDIPGLSIRNIDCRRYRNVRELSEWLDLFLSSVGIRQAHLISACSVGMLAIYFASQFPQRVLSVSALGFPNLQKRDHFNSLTREILIRTVDDADRVLNMLFYRTPSLPTIVKRFYVNQIKNAANDIEFRLTTLLNAMPIVESRISTLNCPIYLISGSHDIFSDLVFLTNMERQIPSCSFKLIEACGHLPYIEKSEAVAAALKEFYTFNQRDNIRPPPNC